MSKEIRTVEALGIVAPLPLLDLKRALDGLDPGEMVELLSDDPAMASDVEMFIEASGHELAGITDEDGIMRFSIRKL